MWAARNNYQGKTRKKSLKKSHSLVELIYDLVAICLNNSEHGVSFRSQGEDLLQLRSNFQRQRQFLNQGKHLSGSSTGQGQ